MSDYDPGAARASELRELAAQVERIETALSTMAAWLVQAQTGFGAQDARGIDRILRGDANQEGDRPVSTSVIPPGFWKCLKCGLFFQGHKCPACYQESRDA